MSVQTEIDSRTGKLREALSASNTELAKKGGRTATTISDIPSAVASIPAASELVFEGVTVTPTGKTFTKTPGAGVDGFNAVTVAGDSNLKPENIVSGVTIYGVEGSNEGGAAELESLYVTPTGEEFTKYPEETGGFSDVTVAGDYNLRPENIAEGVSIYGIEGTLKIGAPSTIPPEYEDFVEHAKGLYTGDYANIAILESNNILNVAFLMDDFTVLSYNESTTEFTAIGWLYCEYTKATQTWRVVDYRETASTGTNYVKHIRYSSVYWEYNGQIIWPVGAGGGGTGGGGSGVSWLSWAVSGCMLSANMVDSSANYG